MKILFLILVFIFNLSAETQILPEDFVLKLNVVYLEDKSLPSISEKDIQQIIETAKEELKIRFNANYIDLKYMGKQDINIFFNKYLNKQSLYYKSLLPFKYKFFSEKIDYQSHKEQIIEFLKQWKLWNLKEFFKKEDQEKINTYDDVLEFLFKEYKNKLTILENLRLKNGSFLINRNYNEYNSYINWLVAMYFQDLYDIIITNTIIVYDDISKPYPHAVLRYAKVGGSSFESPKRKIFDGTSAMINLFEMLTDIEYFKPNKELKSIKRELWNKIIGSFIFAHEMAHMIYLIPDVYDHPKQCLMDSSYATMDYYKGYQILQNYPFPCPKCEPYVTAREHHFLADRLFKNNQYKEAIEHYRISAKMTPDKLDIDYNKYLSLIYYKIGNSYIKLNDKENAIFYLNKSLNLDSSNTDAKKLLDTLK